MNKKKQSTMLYVMCGGCKVATDCTSTQRGWRCAQCIGKLPTKPRIRQTFRPNRRIIVEHRAHWSEIGALVVGTLLLIAYVIGFAYMAQIIQYLE